MRIPLQVVAVHRWLGVLLCLFMAAWFASGAVLMYVPFPALSTAEQFDRRSEVDTTRIALSPVDAIELAGGDMPLDRLRLVARDGRPLYVLSPRGGVETAVWADDGRPAALQSAGEAATIAAEFSGQRVDRVDGPVEFDQWIVHQGFDAGRPYYRVVLDDRDGTVLYVSIASGEVLQRTRRSERLWNYVGAVVHWIYPTILRQNWVAWDQVVWWLALAGIVVAILGIWLGIDRTAIALRRRGTRFTLFRGWMKWHHLLGLVSGAFVLTWIFSGWLSMDHGRIFSMPDPTAQQVDRFRGMSLFDAARRIDAQSLRDLGAFREAEFAAVGGQPLLVVRSVGGERIVAAGRLPDSAETSLIGLPLIERAVANAWPGSGSRRTALVPDDDLYRQVRQGRLPDSAVRVELDDARQTWVHVDARSGEILSVMDRGRRVYRWLYHGLHSLDFPFLVNRRPLWDVVMLSLLALGFGFSVTGLVLGVRRLRRSMPG